MNIEKNKKSNQQIMDMLQGSFSFNKLNLIRVETVLLSSSYSQDR